MNLKDIGHILRSHADTWLESKPVDKGDYSKGWVDAMHFCGESLGGLLDKCNVEQLDEELSDD